MNYFSFTSIKQPVLNCCSFFCLGPLGNDYCRALPSTTFKTYSNLKFKIALLTWLPKLSNRKIRVKILTFKVMISFRRRSLKNIRPIIRIWFRVTLWFDLLLSCRWIFLDNQVEGRKYTLIHWEDCILVEVQRPLTKPRTSFPKNRMITSLKSSLKQSRHKK